MDKGWEDTETRCPPTLLRPLDYRSDQFCLTLLFETKGPREHG